MSESFPRYRRLRRTPWLRAMVAEHRLHVSDLIWPIFVQEGKNKVTKVPNLPGIERLSVDKVVLAAKEAAGLGIPAVALFPVVPANKKTPDAKEALNPENILCQAIRAVKKAVPGIGIIGDVALDPYISHGHDGVLGKDGDVDNDATVAVLCKQAVLLAKAGCDIIAPSDMMDGRVAAIRAALDAAGFTQIPILSYAVKYASAFYDPFRLAVGSKQSQPIDKRTYQMDVANSDEAIREALQDIKEGADMIMVKPGLLCLDIIAKVKQSVNVPVVAYHVSGEYAMLKAAAAAGLLDDKTTMLETLFAFKRAGADAIITYAARDVAKRLRSSS
jgi:porphobilinogen synthase